MSIHTVWLDLAKLRHFGNILRVFGQILKASSLFGKILNLFWPKFYTIGQIYTVINGQMLKKNLAIWSHCQGPTYHWNLEIQAIACT